MEEEGRRFPDGRFLRAEDREALRLSRELSEVLHELNNRVFNYWQADKENYDLWKSSADLVICCASLIRGPVAMGSYVLAKSRPYWMNRTFLGEQQREALLYGTDASVHDLIERATALEARIRELAGVELSESPCQAPSCSADQKR